MKITITHKANEKAKKKNIQILRKYWNLIYPPDLVKNLTLERPTYEK
jgi:hypothetical protein